MNTLFSDYDLIILTMSRWDDEYSSTIYSLAKEWAQRQRVFYIDHPFTIKDILTHPVHPAIKHRLPAWIRGGQARYSHPKGLPPNFVAITSPPVLPINFLSAGDTFERLSRFNDSLLFATILKTIKDFNIQKYLFINSFDPFFGRTLPSEFHPDLYIYQSTDAISQEPYVARHGVRLENEMVANADLTLCTSQELTRQKSQFSAHTHLLPNAADIGLFRRALDQNLPVPTDLRPLTDRPIVIYTGNLTAMRFDFPLMTAAAQYHTDKHFVCIGPYLLDEARNLAALPNVHFLGPKNIDLLPAYLQHANCAVIPFKINTLTQSIYPLKINEYLAAGKPVVTTCFSDDIKQFEHIAHVCNNTQEFVRQIDQALLHDTNQDRQARLNFAEANGWPQRAQLFWEIITPYLTAKLTKSTQPATVAV